MIFIDLENKAPTMYIPNWDPTAKTQQWVPWSKERWDAWLTKSQQLVNDLASLEAAGKQDERNALIDANSDHWGALKEWLLALSAGKCWFSEVRELYSHYDVEHFRPKKEAKALDKSMRDGYWWLAFDYMNFRVCGNVGNRKKGGWFPLEEGSRISTYANQCEESESAYLLDPIDIDDVNLLAFDEEGRVIARPDASEWQKQRVAETVLRLKLNEHAPLAEERRKVFARVSDQIRKYERAAMRHMNGGNEVARQNAKDAARQIREMTRPNVELSAVAKWCVLIRNNQKLSSLVL